MKRFIVKRREGILGLSSFFFMVLLLSQPVAAISNTPLVRGATKLINDLTSVFLALGPVVAVACIIFFFIRLQAADEMDQKKWQNRIKIALVGGVGVVVTSLTLKAILAYF